MQEFPRPIVIAFLAHGHIKSIRDTVWLQAKYNKLKEFGDFVELEENDVLKCLVNENINAWKTRFSQSKILS